MPPPPISPHFPPTQWTVLARLAGSKEESDQALSALCSTYWSPVYAYLRGVGEAHQDAEDLTQGFFAMLVKQDIFGRAQQEEGKLRSFLLGSLERFLANERRFQGRQKRGGGAVVLSLDHPGSPAGMEAFAADSVTPAEAFDRAWVAVLLQQVMQHLREQYQDAGKEEIFTALMPWLLDTGMESQQAAAAGAGWSITNFRLQLHRLRSRYREALHREIAATLGDEREVAGELAHLFQVTGRSL